MKILFASQRLQTSAILMASASERKCGQIGLTDGIQSMSFSVQVPPYQFPFACRYDSMAQALTYHVPLQNRNTSHSEVERHGEEPAQSKISISHFPPTRYYNRFNQNYSSVKGRQAQVLSVTVACTHNYNEEAEPF